MKIDLHIHSNFSDGRMALEKIFEEAKKRAISALSITDHDSMDAQEKARVLADRNGIHYLNGLELSVSFPHPSYNRGKPVSLDFLGYGYDKHHEPLALKLAQLREYRKRRAAEILERINHELEKEGLEPFTHEDLKQIEASVDGAFGRPHIAAYMVKKGVTATRQEAFDKYLVKCNVPKMPLSLPEASELVRGAGGKLMLAHPNHPRGTSLVSFTHQLEEQQEIIKETMLPYIDGLECWHSEQDRATVDSYLRFAQEMGIMVTGGSDCHQNPLLMGTVDVPSFVARQFEFPSE